MLERVSKFLLVIVLGSSMLSGCSHMTTQGRQQLAYARYVKKFSHNRVRQKNKFKKVKMPKPTIESHSSPSANTSDSPQSATLSGGEN